MKYLYQVADLILQSNEKIPGLFPAPEHAADSVRCTIHLGLFDASFSSPPVIEKPFTRLNEQELLYEIPDMVKLWVRFGKEIYLDLQYTTPEEGITWLYQNGLAALLLQRGKIPFRASGIIDQKGRLWLLSGNMGSGKTTMLVKLMEKGYAFFSDDFCAFQIEDGQLLAYPTLPFIRLWDLTARHQSVFPAKNPDVTLGEKGKTGYYAHTYYNTEPRTVAGIFFLDHRSTEESLTVISPIDALPLMQKKVFRDNWLTGKENLKNKFRVLTNLSRKAPVWEAKAEKGKKSMESLSTMIAQKIEAHES